MLISLVINTLNEEKNIQECIVSAKKWVNEIIVCDMHSDDATVEIAKSLGAKIIYHERIGYVEPARYLAISQALNEWVLVLDADERLTSKLGEKLVSVAKDTRYDAVSFASLFEYFGGFFNNNWTRFFKKEVYLKTYNKNELTVHQNFNALFRLGKKRRLTLTKQYHIVHHAYPTIEKYITKTVDRYARIEAEQKFIKRERFSILKMIYDLVKTFLMSYIMRRGFLDGTKGLILCFFYAAYRFNIWANLWFLEKKEKQ